MNSTNYRIGFASRDVSPPVGWRIVGKFAERQSRGIQDPLFAKALFVRQGKTAFVIVANDLCSVPRPLTDIARKRIAASLGIPQANVIITATHTHGAPEYYGPCRDLFHARAKARNLGIDPYEPLDYQSLLINAWLQVATAAAASAVPAGISVVVPRQFDVAYTQRFLMRDGSIARDPTATNPEVLQAHGPIDPDLPFIFATALDGRFLGSLTVFGLQITASQEPVFSACYPGVIDRNIKQELTRPATNLFCLGCAADVNYLEYLSEATTSSSAGAATIIGNTLSDTLLTAMSDALKLDGKSLVVDSTVVLCELKTRSPEQLTSCRESILANPQRPSHSLADFADACNMLLLDQYWSTYGREFPIEVQAIRLDADTAIVSIPHEVFVDLGVAIKASSPFSRTILISLANDIDFCLPPRRAFADGGHHTISCPLQLGCGEHVARATVELLWKLKES